MCGPSDAINHVSPSGQEEHNCEVPKYESSVCFESHSISSSNLNTTDPCYTNGSADFFRSLNADYGIKFLILTSLTSHWLKGFCRSQFQQSIRFLLQLWGVPGPQLDTYQSIADVPWSMKPLIAIVSDMFPILGFKKIPYVVLATCLGLAGICVAAFLPAESTPVEAPVMGLFCANLCWMTADILVEGLFSRRMACQPKSGPNFVVYVTVGQHIACLISAVVSGLMLTKYIESGPQLNLALCLVPTTIYLYPIIANFGSEEKVVSGRATRLDLWNAQRAVVVLSIIIGCCSLLFALVGILLRGESPIAFSIVLLIVLNFLIWASFSPAIGKMAVFLAIVSVTNLSIAGSAQYFYTDSEIQYPEGPHFEPMFFITVCGVVGAVVAIFAMIVFALFKNAKYRLVYLCLITLNAILSAPNSILFSRLNRIWGISDHVFVATDTALQTAIQTLFFAPAMLLLSRVCPDQLESSMYAILASNTNFAATISGPIGGFICESFGITPDGSLNESVKFENMWKANLLMAGLKLTPLAFLWLLPNCRMSDSLDSIRSTVSDKSPIKRLLFAYRANRR